MADEIELRRGKRSVAEYGMVLRMPHKMRHLVCRKSPSMQDWQLSRATRNIAVCDLRKVVRELAEYECGFKQVQ